MHGYQIIREIDERSGGAWKPSAGSVYPTLQLLADEGLVPPTETDGRKVYSLTEAGRAAAEVDPSARGSPSARRRRPRSAPCRRRASSSPARTAQVGRTGSPEQVDEAVAVLDEARRRIYSILAQD